VSYIVWHPGTNTIIDSEESYLVDTSLLPENFDEWEDYLSQKPWITAYRIVRGKEVL